jgi:hypothetical protein
LAGGAGGRRVARIIHERGKLIDQQAGILRGIQKVLSATTVRLLRAAAEIVGGEKALCERLSIAETLLDKFMADICELPDLLLLRTVDIILEHRQSRLASPTGAQSREILCK